MIFGTKQRIHRHHIRRWSPVGHRLPELQGTLPALGGTTGDDGGAVGKGVHQISGLRAAADGLPPHFFVGGESNGFIMNRMDLNHDLSRFMGSDLGKITEGLSTSGMVKDLSIQLSVLGSLDDPKRTLNCCNSRSTTDKSPWNKKKNGLRDPVFQK